MTFNKSALLAALTLATSVSAIPTATESSGGPCDIYASGGTPCVAAHSTTRALYSSYTGPLYSVLRASDNTIRNISPVSAGGVANAAAQDSFCSGTTCHIKAIYDQTGHANHLTLAPDGGAASGDYLATASAAPVTLNCHRAYGVYVSPGVGYRNDKTYGIATGNDPEGLYAVLDGTHYNSGCCFDYGNAETSNTDTGAGHMEAIYFGSNSFWGSGAGEGPWLQMDAENGLFSGYNPKQNLNDPSLTSRFVTAVLKGDSSNLWSIRSGNSQSGGLTTHYSGQRPSGYYPMKKEGAIVLGIGGDNSNSGQGTFYEGVMTSGYPADATEDAVQANIVAAGYRA
ncbi:related to Alpha arabinofuranosidase [Sporisorium reilianum SRZ2]|uniref:Alpha-L-arabinofuranosidase n=1 Tax=Sporisorium reilianum (strain SRZ2) TaxID=999809 RepID=E6ZWS5_SPORE|nr:related to Alpha arabinofuranosidase [Sporisorium reilianum SRZ2]